MLKLMREARGLTQDELAQRVGLSQAHISRLEAGQSRYPAEHLVRLAEALALTAQERADLLAWAAAQSAERSAA